LANFSSRGKQLDGKKDEKNDEKFVYISHHDGKFTIDFPPSPNFPSKC
jgi:hypothetical protein